MKEMETIPLHLLTPPAETPDGYRFRLAKEKDLKPLYKTFFLGRRLMEFNAYFQRQLARQEREQSFWLVVESATGMVGSAQCTIYPHGTELANLIVVPDHQNRGIGSAMIHILIELARHVGQTDIEIGVSADNQRAYRLYCRLGFVEDRILSLKDNKPAVVLRKEI